MKLTPALRADYEKKFNSCVVDYEKDKVMAVAKRLYGLKKHYVGFWSVPWWFVALTHLRECNNDMKGVLHNGEKIIGTGQKTKLVPAGYGPFDTFEESARSALARQGLDKETDWSVGKALYRIEGFNGYGYQTKGVPSPYLWSHTNHYADGSWDNDPKGGKYYADHKWSPDIYDSQLGVCGVLKCLMEIDPTIQFGTVTPTGAPVPTSSVATPVAKPTGSTKENPAPTTSTSPGIQKETHKTETGLIGMCYIGLIALWTYAPWVAVGLGLALTVGVVYGILKLKDRFK